MTGSMSLGLMGGFLLEKSALFYHLRRAQLAAPGGDVDALGFAQVVAVLELLSLYPPIKSAVHFVAFVVSILAIWLGAATAHKLKGWRAALLPLIAVLVYVLGSIAINSLAAGAGFTVQALLYDIGMVAR